MFFKPKNLKSENFRFFRFLIFQVKIFTLYKLKSVNLGLLEFIGVAIIGYRGLLRNVHHSSVWDNLRALLEDIFESSVPLILKT